MSDPRQQRGLEIAATARIVKKGGFWIVPSQSGNGRYKVNHESETPHCTCPDHETRGVKCKHIFAVDYVIRRERRSDGTTTIIETLTVRETVKKTYPQNWKAYNAAQTHEKEEFLACYVISVMASPSRRLLVLDGLGCQCRMLCSHASTRFIRLSLHVVFCQT